MLRQERAKKVLRQERAKVRSNWLHLQLDLILQNPLIALMLVVVLNTSLLSKRENLAVADPGNRKGGLQTIEREARKIWGYAHFLCSKTRGNPILDSWNCCELSTS